MSEETVVAESSAAPALEAQPSFDLPRSGTPEYENWRQTGEIADKPKTEESATSSSETAGESETPQSTQEKPKAETKTKLTADERIAQLEATIEKIRKGSGKETPKAESSPAKPEPKPAPKATAEQEPTPDDKNADGSLKFETYEQFTKALARYEARQERAEWQQAQYAEAQAKAFNAKVEESRSRYENFDEVVQPAATAINTDSEIPQGIKDKLNRSDLLPDILFTIGSDAAELARFVKMSKEDPFEAAGYIATVENLIKVELGRANTDSARNERGQFVAAETEKPAKRGPESAPAPPLEIGSRGSGVKDESERALQAIERGDGRAVSAFFEAENRKDMARRLGR